MKRLHLISYSLLALAMAGSVSCTSTGYETGSPSSPYASSPYSSWYSSPMSQQIRMQEMHSRMMRSMIPF